MQTKTSSRQLRLAGVVLLSAALPGLCTAQLVTPTFQVTPGSAVEGVNPGFVETWDNLGSAGNALDVTQTAASLQPQLITSATPSGASAVRFDGTDDTLSAGTVASSLFVGNDIATIFMVYRPVADNGSILQWTSGIDDDRVQIADASLIAYAHGSFGGGDIITASHPQNWFNNWHLLTITRNGSAGTIRADGAETADTFPLTGITPGNTGPFEISRPGFVFNGDIAEIRIYNTAPGAGDIAAIEGQLTQDYLTPIPEPSEYAMMFGVLCVVGAFARRQWLRKQANLA
jgi:hypothetical protein